MNRLIRICVGGFLLFVALGVGQAHAHEPGLSSATLQVRESAVRLEVVFAPIDLQWALPPEKRDGGARWIMENSPEAQATLIELGRRAWRIDVAGAPIAAGACSVSIEPGENNVSFHLVYPQAKAGNARFEAVVLRVLSAGHREFLTVLDETGRTVSEKLLSQETAGAEFVLRRSNDAADESETSTPTFGSFVRLGVEHILTGYDHLLFLFGLLLVCRRISSILGIITCFTVAHSITLALAALNMVSLPSSIVEPAIAASIVFVGIENLLRREDPRGRKALTFLFGLVHGFGFASALRELGLGTDGKALFVPLFSFNLGVEIGQLAVAALILPILWRLRRAPAFVPRWMPAMSLVVAVAGLYWLVERTLFS